MANENAIKPNKWFTKFKKDLRYKQKFLNELEKTGAPLEIRAEHIFFEHGYYSTEARYEDSDDGRRVSRQIDFLAHKRGVFKINTKLRNFTIYLKYNIVGDCTSLSDQSLIVFELSDEIKRNTLVRLPIFVNGSSFSYKIHENSSSLRDCIEWFNIENITRKIIQVNVENGLPKRFQSSKEKQRVSIYNKCEQIMSALRYYYEDRWRRFSITEYMNARKSSGLDKKIENHQLWKASGNIQDNTRKVISEVIDSFNPKFLSGHITIYGTIPLMIVNEETMILKAMLDNNSHSIEDLEEIKYCIYLHAPADISKYRSIIERRYEQPIIVCNIKYMDECLDKIHLGLEKIRKEMDDLLILYKRLVDGLIPEVKAKKDEEEAIESDDEILDEKEIANTLE
ncbi:hypothetical protein DRN58_04845 [Thermococci archaeon]|nr:MAG: hypothetical protein DRN58_04845 [Thermococci archaeon]